ncbi:MAG: ribonuclease III [Oscillospiraceae bacterium]|nr:ribonuclease III [Oscillospiraceae bacterium]
MTDYFSPAMSGDALRAMSSIALAHVGDAVYELLARTYLCLHGKATGKGLHRAAVALVRAEKQAELSAYVLPLLNGEERDVFRRGRNANVHTVPQHAARAEYQTATALEALFGWLYLKGEKERANALFAAMMEGNDAA